MTTVSITKQPTYRLGPRTGIRCEGSVKSEDVEVTDDLLVHGDAEVVGTLYVGTLSSGADVSTDHIVAPLTVDAGSHLTAAAGVTNIDYALSTGAFTSPSGTNTLSGDVAVASGKDITMAGTGTLTTGTGNVTLAGDVFISANKDLTMGTAGDGTGTLMTGTGAIALNGAITIAADKGIVLAGASTGDFDLSLSTGETKTTTGANTIGGDVTVAKGKHLTLGVAGGQGAGKFEWLSTGIFTTSSGANTLSGDTTITGSKTFTTGTGAVTIKGDVGIDAGKDLVMGTAGSGTGEIKTGTGAIALNGSPTVATGKTLAVTDADKLTVGGKIVPQYLILNVPMNADSVDQWVFVADAAYELDTVELSYTVASTSGTFDLKKSTTVQAPASGDTMLTGTVDISQTANTVYAGTKHGTEGNRRLADGNKLSVCFTGTMTGLAGGVVTIRLFRV